MAENGHGGVEDEENTINNNNNNGGDKEEEELSVPRGGPIYVSNFVGPLTSVSLFKPSIVEQLQGLEDEVALNSSLVPDEDISVDELKILTDEELVDMAIKEAFKDDNDAPDLPLVPHPPDEGRTGDPGTSSEIVCKKKSRKTKRNKGNKCALEDDKDVPNLSLIPQSSDEGRGDPGTSSDVVCKKKSGKRKRNEHALEETYMEKVEHVRRIKAKQDEEKAAVKLHSFNPSSQTNDTDATSSKTIERMKPLRSASSALKVKSSFIQDTIPVHYPEVALSIEVYHYARRWIKHQEFLVLGQQTLTELRDKIYCLTDHVMQKAGQHDPSGYFLIEETFCNDLRDQSAIDYSEPIFDWINNYADNANKKWECIVAGELQKKQKAVVGNDSGSELPSFRALDMHKTRFSDLKFRLGAGYLYCHQGDCRHTIVIRDMRLVHPEDIQNRAAYPILLFQVKPVVRKCNVCRIFRATKVTVDDKWAQENPCYFCDDCYYLLHYKDGCLLYDDFSVHDYQHD